MLTAEDTLSPQELAEVTGKARAASQAGALGIKPGEYYPTRWCRNKA